MDSVVRLVLEDKLQQLGVSRYELAKRTGIQYQIIDNYYKNRVRRYDRELLLKICLALGCEVGDIIKVVTSPTEE